MSKPNDMKEDFLYYLWENRLISGALTTTEGMPVEIVNPGFRNQDSGPDFREAKVRIGGQLWAGQVEIHVRTSDWNRHGHQYDKAYRNVMLHVVYEHDTPVNSIPVLELKGHFDPLLYSRFEQIVMSQRWIACERQLCQIKPFIKNVWLERMAVERLEEKSKNVAKILNANKFDWEDTLYRLLMRYFGMKVNNEAFETLASLLPYKTLLKHADHLEQVEAMLLGCAGFLNHQFEEPYPQLLQREFKVMQAKFGLPAMSEERWKFMRMRPINFPTVRLAQLAQMIYQHGCLFSKIKTAETADDIKTLFDVKASEYWDTHFRFSAGLSQCGSPATDNSPSRPKHLGEGISDVLMINAVIPTLFCYGQFHKDLSFCDKAMRFLESLAAEDNTIIRHFSSIEWFADNAMQSQALLHLYNHFCHRKRCLECSIGNNLLRSNKD